MEYMLNIHCWACFQLAIAFEIDGDLTHTSSAVLVTESKPMYEKKTIEDPVNIPFIPNGKNLKSKAKCEVKYY